MVINEGNTMWVHINAPVKTIVIDIYCSKWCNSGWNPDVSYQSWEYFTASAASSVQRQKSELRCVSGIRISRLIWVEVMVLAGVGSVGVDLGFSSNTSSIYFPHSLTNKTYIEHQVTLERESSLHTVSRPTVWESVSVWGPSVLYVAVPRLVGYP